MEPSIIRGLGSAKKAFPEASFIVFGSRALGTARHDSDIDLCAIFPEVQEDSFETAYKVRAEIHKYLDEALDVIVCDQEGFHRRSREPWTIEAVIARDGVPL